MGTNYVPIFSALAAPFPQRELKQRTGQGGRTLHYITARQVMNRLDDVVGPENWEDTYTETKEGMKCRLVIVLPDGQHVAKEDGAGFCKMDSGEDAEKSGFSESFKRAAVKFGIGRYLYRDGMPNYVRDALGLSDKRATDE